ncbi:translocation/assembly module TamB domain-containing protein [Azotosporobacter soli]|uniref:translocation/assembly module TamB domain-containing protein n=1 Tax=Azotosporobacter soli TaxID=3055040 RepID=UPI0031FED5EB
MKNRWKWLLLSFSLLIIGAALLSGKALIAELKEQLPARLSEELGMSVTIGRMEATSFNSLAANDVTVLDGDAKLLTVPQLKVSVNPLRILQGKPALAMVSSVVLEKPSLWLRQKQDGTWNIDKLLQKERAEKSSFSGVVQINLAEIEVQSQGRIWMLDELNGTADCADLPALQLDFNGKVSGQDVRLSGRYHSSGRSGMTLTAKRLDLAEYAPFYPRQYDVASVNGQVEDLVLTLNGNKGHWTFAGETAVKEGAATFGEWSVSEVAGRVIFSEHSLYAVAAGKVMEQAVKLNGQADWSTGAPRLNGTLTLKQADISRFWAACPVTGLVDADLTIAGAYDQPVVSGELRAAQLNWQQYQAEKVKISAVFAEGKLTLSQAEAEMLGGAASLSGTLDSKTQRYALSLRAKDISLQGIRIDALQSSFQGNSDDVEVDALALQIGEGSVTGQGRISRQNIDMALAGNQLPLERFTPEISGNGTFSGRLSGRLPEWQLTGTAALHDGTALKQPYQLATGGLRLDAQGVTLDNWLLRDKTAEHRVDGRISYAADGPLNLRVVSRQARAENVVKFLLPGEEITGNIDNEIVLHGSRARPDGSGHVKLSDGSFRGRLVARAEGDYSISGQELQLKGVEIDSLNTRIRVSGQTTRGAELNLAVAADNLDFARLPFQYPYPVSGIGTCSGTLTGTAAQPIFAGEFQTERLQLDKETIQNIRGKMKFVDDELDITDASFQQGEGQGVFTGGIDFKDQSVFGSLQLKNLTLERIMPIFQLSNRDLRGKLSGEIRVAGHAKQPDVWVDGQLTNGSIRNYPLESVDLNLALENNVLKINQLTAHQGNGTLVAQGTAAIDGPLNLEIGGQGIDAGIITALLGSDWDLKGKLQFAAQVNGTTQEPQAAMSVEINDGGVKEATFDSLYGLLILEKGNIQVNQVLLRKGIYRASAYGNIPLAALTPKGRSGTDNGSEMDLRCRLDNANLSILPLLVPKVVEWGDGATQGEIAITGTLHAPKMNGAISVNGGKLKFAGFKDPLENIIMNVTVADDVVKVNQLSAKLGTGTIALDGSLRWQDWHWRDYDLALKLNAPLIRHAYFTGPVRGELTLRPGQNGIPLLAGDLIFEQDTITVPGVPEFGASNLDLGLDLNIAVGNRVRAYHPLFYDILARGRLHFGGTLKEPSSSGRVRVMNGTINYLSTTFKIFEGSVDFNRPFAFEPTIRLAAQAKLPQLAVDLTVNGPVSALDFKLTSEPALSQAQIMAVLNAGGRTGDVRDRSGFDEVSGLLNAGLQAKFLGQLEGNVRNAFGLDQFRINQGAKGEILRKTYFEKEGTTTDNREVYNLQLGKYINDRLFVSYNMAIGYSAYEAALRYDLTRRISVIAATDDQKRKWLGFEARFKF